MIDLKELGKTFQDDLSAPTLLYQQAGHSVYWLGLPEPTAFRCNIYLVVSNEEAVIIDPGGSDHFARIHQRVAQIIRPELVVAVVVSHQDPDVAASFPLWVDINPSMKVVTSPRTNILLSHYRDFRYEYWNVSEHPEFRFTSGQLLRFIPSPFLHAPGAFTTYDQSSGFLFSGDIWSAMDMEWQLVVEDFHHHELKMNLFHLDYMASRVAARGYVNRIAPLPVNAILPQHGSIIPGEMVQPAMDYLAKLRCGLDIIYPELR